MDSEPHKNLAQGMSAAELARERDPLEEAKVKALLPEYMLPRII